MKIIGLTGGIGTGKSTVARFLAELGAVVIDADKLGHELFKPGTEAWHEVVAAFGNQVLNAKGEIDRKKLGDIVFNNPAQLQKLNRIMHPKIRELARARIEELRREGVGVVMLEAPLLVEAEWIGQVDKVWVTTAPEKTVINRLKAKSGLSEAQIKARICAQMPNSERLKHADVVINTDCSLDELRNKVKSLWRGLRPFDTLVWN